MLDLIAQATQPVSWKTWDATTWLFFIGGLVSILVGAWAKIQAANAQNAASQAQHAATQAQGTATDAAVTASAAKAATDVNTQRVSNLSAQTFDIAKQMTPPGPTSPPAPTPESIANGLAKPENQ